MKTCPDCGREHGDAHDQCYQCWSTDPDPRDLHAYRYLGLKGGQGRTSRDMLQDAHGLMVVLFLVAVVLTSLAAWAFVAALLR